MDFKRIFISLIVLLNFILISSFVYSSCDYNPDRIVIYSGNYNLGNYSDGDLVYINSNLDDYPIYFKFYFDNDETGCFNSNDDVTVKLFQSSSDVSADSYNENDLGNNIYETEFDFLFSADVTISGAFTSTYTVKDSISGDIDFDIDTDPPDFISLSIPSDYFYPENYLVEISYLVQDTESGLDSITLNGGTFQLKILDGNYSSSGVFNETLTSDTTFCIEVKDILGHSNKANFTLRIDNQAPTILNIEKSYSFESGIRRVSLNVEVEDDSYEYLDNSYIPDLSLDASPINSNLGVIQPDNCVKSELNNKSYLCSFNDIEITLDSTQNVDLNFTLSDDIGNTISQIRSEEIFVDYDGPEIVDFYLINTKGIKNIFSAYENNTRIYLKFTDSSISNEGLFTIPRIIPEFSDLDFVTTDNCSLIDSNTIECVWDLENKLNIFSLKESGNTTFKVTIIDNYGNPSSDSFIAYYDNKLPELSDFKIEETTSIKDNIIQSGEIVDFKIYIRDDNIEVNNQFFVDGLFNRISPYDQYLNFTPASCHAFNSTDYECVFRGIKVGTGYFENPIYFRISDIAGNEIIRNYSIEVFKISNESNQVFLQNLGYDILNPINRNAIIDSGVVAWFQGKLELNSIYNYSDNPISIINFQIKSNSCDELSLDPLLISNYEMYPNEIKYGNGNFSEDSEFAIRFELADDPNYNDLNDKSMNCVLSVLYRDSTTIYPPEDVNISLNFAFYDLPRGNILYANAQKILEMTDEVEFMNGWFGTMYDIYKIFDNICQVIGTANTVMGMVAGVWTGVSLIMYGSKVMAAQAKAGDAVVYKSEGVLSEIFGTAGSVVKKMCDWVTCRNGGILGSVFNVNLKDIPGLKELYEAQDMISDAVCSVSDIGGGNNDGEFEYQAVDPLTK